MLLMFCSKKNYESKSAIGAFIVLAKANGLISLRACAHWRMRTVLIIAFVILIFIDRKPSRRNLKYFLWVHIYDEAYRALILGQGSNALC